MLDLIRMDLYRMFKMKSMLVTTLIYTLYAYFFTWAELAMFDDAFSTEYGVYLMISSTLPMFFINLFAVLFITFDTHSGFIKSYVGQIPSRTYRLASKLICSMIYQLIAFVYIVAAETVLCAFISGNVKFGDAGKLVKFLAVAFLIQCALVCVITMLTTVFKTHVAPIIFSVCISLGFVQTFTYLIYLLLNVVFEIDFDPTKYLLTTRMTDFCDSYLGYTSRYSLSSTVCLALVYIVISLAASVVIFRKKDLS